MKKGILRIIAHGGAVAIFISRAHVAQAADLPEELPPATDLQATTTLSYLGADDGYSHGVRVTFAVPREELFDEFFPGSGLDPFYCAVERRDGSDWTEVVSPTFCQPFDPGWADVGGLEPGTSYSFRVVLYQDESDGNQNYIRKSPASEIISITTAALGTPNLRSTCLLSFGEPPEDGSIPLSWQIDAGALEIDAFEIQRTEEPGTDWVTITTLEVSEPEVSYAHRDSGLSTEQDYYYRVRAEFTNGSSGPWSKVVKERATEDRDWCDTDRAALTGAADAVGSSWPGLNGGSAGMGGASNGPGGNDSAGGSNDAETDGAAAGAPDGASEGSAEETGAEGCGCRAAGSSTPTRLPVWFPFLAGGALLVQRRRFRRKTLP